MGQVALYAAIVSFAGAALLLTLSVLGFVHRGRVGADETIGARVPAAVTA
jgi:hypothetical protein